MRRAAAVGCDALNERFGRVFFRLEVFGLALRAAALQISAVDAAQWRGAMDHFVPK
jgi:hypothetical protein